MQIPNNLPKAPWVVKEARGERVFVCKTLRQLKEAVAALSKVPFQVQKYLNGYHFVRVRYVIRQHPLVTKGKVVDGKVVGEVEEVDADIRRMAIGVTRRMADACFGLGASVFSFNVAVSGNTALVVSFKPDCMSFRPVH